MKHTFEKIKSCLCLVWQWYVSQYKGTWYQRIVAPIATFVVLFFLYLGAVDVNFLYLFGVSPTEDVIQNPISNEASYIYTEDSVLLGKYFNENRSPVAFEDISPYVINALISTEDERFYQHHGIDYQGVFAAFKDMMRGNARGASTITQQLVKNLFKIRSQYSTGLLGNIPGLKILVQKSKEWITAIKIENLYSKKDILTLYLNTVDFGSNAYGIRTAAKTYFNTEPANLTAEQSATLVGLLKATTTYNPRINPKNSFDRRNTVLLNMLQHDKMFTVGNLTRAMYDSLVQIPIDMDDYQVEDVYSGHALYFREAIRDELRDWCKANGVNLDGDGLKIYTTIDSKMQLYAEWAVNKQMKQVQDRFNEHWRGQNPWRDQYGKEIPNFIEDLAKKTSYYKILDRKYNGNSDSIDFYMNEPHPVKVFAYGETDKNGQVEKMMSTMDSIRYMVSFMHAGFVAMEPQTSHVKAWVGDIDFTSWKYDKVTAMRQPGSTFKLFVYASAFEHNDSIDPEYCLTDVEVNMQVEDKFNPGTFKWWHPHNADGTYGGAYVPLRQAFAESINTVAAKLGLEVGIPNIIRMAQKMGVKSPLDDTPSLSLGPCDVQLIELVDAYCSVMNDGMQRDPIMVSKIIDRDGKVVYDAEKDSPQAKRAMKYKTAYYMQRLLWAGANQGGTSTSVRNYMIGHWDTEVGGKTGTSNNHSDAWFIGCTPNLVGGAWVGGEYRSIHFRNGALGQGSRTALPIFGYFIQKVLGDKDARYKKYHAKYPDAKEDIPVIEHHYDYPANRSDSDSIITVDPLDVDADLDLYGEPYSEEEI